MCFLDAAACRHLLYVHRAVLLMQAAIARQVDGMYVGLRYGPAKGFRKRTPVPAFPGQAAQENPGAHRSSVRYQRFIAARRCCSRLLSVGIQRA